jgi:hypothetical protein
LTKIYPWQLDIIEAEKSFTDNELLDEVLFWAEDIHVSDTIIEMNRWIFNYYCEKLYKRLDFVLPPSNKITSFNYEPVTN